MRAKYHASVLRGLWEGGAMGKGIDFCWGSECASPNEVGASISGAS